MSEGKLSKEELETRMKVFERLSLMVEMAPVVFSLSGRLISIERVEDHVELRLKLYLKLKRIEEEPGTFEKALQAVRDRLEGQPILLVI